MTPLYFLLLCELCVVCFFDLKERKIRNVWSLFHLALYPLILLVFKDQFTFSFDGFIIPVVILLIGFLLFALKVAGGGDVKFLSTFVLLIPFEKQESFVGTLLLVTIFVALFFIVYNLGRSWKKVWLAIRAMDFYLLKDYFGSRFPYSIVIILSWIYWGWIEGII